jgi:beta-lactamase class A
MSSRVEDEGCGLDHCGPKVSSLLRALRSEGITVGIEARRVDGSVIAASGSDHRFYAASTIKLAVLVALLRAVERGEVHLGDLVEVTEEFPSAVDRSHYRLDPEDVDHELFDRFGAQARVGDLAEAMIVISSNEATNLLLPLAGGPDGVSRVASALGASELLMERGIGDRAAAAAGLSNTVTAAGLVALMLAVARDQAGSATSCATMRAVLSRHQLRQGIARGLPEGSVVASKSGFVTGIVHDVGLVMARDRPSYALAVLTEGVSSKEEGEDAIARLAAAIHDDAHLFRRPISVEGATAPSPVVAR